MQSRDSVRMRGIPMMAACALIGLISGCGWSGSTASTDRIGLTPMNYTITRGSGSRERTITYYEAGDSDGQRVIFIHGTPGTAGVWSRFLADPVPGLESVALDRPGFGASDPRRAESSLAEQAKAIEPLLVKRDGKWPIVVGHSLGGPIAMRVAADYPEKVGGVVILAGALDPSLEDVLFVQHLAKIPPFSFLLSRPLRHSNRELTPLRRELVELGKKLDRVSAPVTIIHGTEDKLVPFENVAYMQTKLVNAKKIEVLPIPGGDHCLQWYAEDLIRDAIVEAATGTPIPVDAVAAEDRALRHRGSCAAAYSS